MITSNKNEYEPNDIKIEETAEYEQYAAQEEQYNYVLELQSKVYNDIHASCIESETIHTFEELLKQIGLEPLPWKAK